MSHSDFFQFGLDERDLALNLFQDLRIEISENKIPPCPHVSEIRQSNLQNRTSVGLSMKGSTIAGLIVGGPSFLCGQLNVGDIIVQVDGTPVTTDNLHQLLLGDDQPGSSVTITAMKPMDAAQSAGTEMRSKNITSVVLERVRAEDIADHRCLQDMLESIQVAILMLMYHAPKRVHWSYFPRFKEWSAGSITSEIGHTQRVE